MINVPEYDFPSVTTLDSDDYIRVLRLVGVVLQSSKMPYADYVTWLNSVISGGSNSIVDGRLTLETGVPVSSSDQLAKTTVYFTPFIGNKISLYNGSSSWDIVNFTEKSVAVPSNTNTPFDIFGYNNSGVLALEALAWTNDTTRATALVYQDGVLVKSGATTRRYLGTGRTTGVSGQCEDSVVNRYLWNKYNQVKRGLFTCPGYNNDNAATTYLTTGTNWAEANGGTGSRIRWVIGEARAIDIIATILTTVGASSGSVAGIGLDSITQADTSGTSNNTVAATFAFSSNNKGLPLAAGGHYASLLICRGGANNATFYADAARRGGEAADSPETYLSGFILN